jgi:hypothetical protein
MQARDADVAALCLQHRQRLGVSLISDRLDGRFALVGRDGWVGAIG